MLDSNRNNPKRKYSVRCDQGRRGVQGRRWAGKASVLDNQKVQKRKKASWGATGPVSEDKASLRGAANWGTEDHSGEWRSRFLEGGFFLAAGLSNVVKNGVDHLVGWVKGGCEAVENVSIPPLGLGLSDDIESLTSDRVEPDLESGYDEAQGADWLLNHEETQIDDSLTSPDDAMLSPDHDILRDNIEWSKMHSQDQEESGLEEDELYDQAGALRSMFSNRNTTDN
jgi:hypothetical protein